MPRLNGSRSTRAPFAAATRDVRSDEPSSTTTMSRPGSNARSSSITRPIVCSSFSAGTIATRRSSPRRGSTVGGAAAATVSLTRLRVASEEDAHAAPPNRDETVKSGDPRRQLKHPRIEHRRQKARKLAILDPPERLRAPPVLDEPGTVAPDPQPAARLLPQPSLAKRDERDPELDRNEHRREQHEQPHRERREDDDEPVPLEVVLLLSAGTLEHVVVQHVGGRDDQH